MHEFESFVYLDMEKTGSTFISRLLNKFAREPAQRQLHHRAMDADFDPKKFYFMSVRNPMDSYLSLYSFGCQQQGKVYARLRNKGHLEYYDRTAEGFGEWLSFVLKKRNADLLRDRYDVVADGRIAGLMGFQSYRYLRLAIPDAEALLDHCETEDDIRAVYEANKLPQFIIRHETFVADLCRLIEGPLKDKLNDVEGALDYARNTEPVNTSERVDKGETEFRIDDRRRRKMQKREWLLNELFAY
jgi:hypothetical protein